MWFSFILEDIRFLLLRRKRMPMQCYQLYLDKLFSGFRIFYFLSVTRSGIPEIENQVKKPSYGLQRHETEHEQS